MLLCCFPNCSTACEHFLWNCLVLAPSCGSVFLIVNWNSPSFYYYYSCLALKISFWHWKAVLGMLTYIRAPGIPLMQEDGPAPAVLPGTLGLASHWRSQQGFLLKIWCSVRFGYIYTLIKPQFIPERPCHMKGFAPRESLHVFHFGRPLLGTQGGRRYFSGWKASFVVSWDFSWTVYISNK